MMRQVRQITVEILPGLSSPRAVVMWVGILSVVRSCLLGPRFPEGLPVAGCMGEAPLAAVCRYSLIDVGLQDTDHQEIPVTKRAISNINPCNTVL